MSGKDGPGLRIVMDENGRDPIAKALEAVAWLVESDKESVGVRELAAALDISPSSAHRILGKLIESGFVARGDETQRYGLGVEFFRIAQLSMKKRSLLKVGVTAMRRLVECCNETALLGVYDAGRQEMIFSASVESTHPLRYVIELNKWMPLHTGASGMAIMAFLGDAEIERIIERTRLAPLTSASITDPRKMRKELAAIRERGYALTRGQRLPGAVGLAAPFFNGSGHVVGDVCLTIPEQRFNPKRVKPLLAQLLACVGEIGGSIGGKPVSISGRPRRKAG